MDIQLRAPFVETSNKIIVVGDVVLITGGTPTLRSKILALDVDEFENGQATTSISAAQIKYRILLGGFAQNAFVMTGGKQLSVHLKTAPNTQQNLETKLIRQLAGNFGIDPADISISISRASLDSLVKHNLDLATIQIEADFGIKLPIGNRRIPVSLHDGFGTSASESFAMSIAVVRDLVIANQNISKGEMIDESNAKKVRRSVNEPNVQLVSFEQVIGKAARKNIQQYSIVGVHDIETPKPNHLTGIKRNRLVTANIRRGRLLVQVKNAKTVTDGKIGGSIEIINPINGKRILATVIDSETVEIR